MSDSASSLRPELSVSGCDTTALVEISRQFAEFEFEALHRNEVTAAQVAADKADWAATGTALSGVYQALCDGETEQAMASLHAIETILMRHGVLVSQPVLSTPSQEDFIDGE
ncbi:MAG: hypothetical protein IJV69_06175 [Kiritimatiellae bacterium]|nr:hypothetical protein [Kiritimatiellia bacterium]